MSAQTKQPIIIRQADRLEPPELTNGKVTRACQIRVVRDGIIIADDKIAGLKRFKEDAKEVAEGYECGIGLEKYNDIKEGDIFEVFTIEEYRED